MVEEFVLKGAKKEKGEKRREGEWKEEGRERFYDPESNMSAPDMNWVSVGCECVLEDGCLTRREGDWTSPCRALCMLVK